jgi:molybdopterin-biosynthesis enzyme MoeA-like protein
MARMPEGSRHIPNPVSTAPGFIIGNVHVMAGVPQVFQAMVAHVVSELPAGQRVLSRAIACPFGEGDIGTALGVIQKAHPQTSIGSYPHFDGIRFSTELIVRARDQALVDAAAADVDLMIEAIRSDKQAALSRDLGTGEVA